ncbi:BglG family transcription antiterminator [Clostridium saccharobutylicum]|uniref:Transcriptional regulator ManR n=1 Tax=Clostridium saccharobutylicum TaxID=169679 RepID=A0A1S8NDK3_CLOSA|nr:BglG family transcription antiterminator [Clostridium saccharobutylicum]OOM14546.1 transcriptional regulator ManR [Clostridium saccharobutylicum]
MLNNRCIDILKLVVNNNVPITIKHIAEKYKISSRTIRYDLDRIDEYLLDINLKPLIRKPNEGISIELNEEEITRFLNLIGKSNSYDYVMSQNERIIYIMYKLLEKNSYVTINSFSEDMLVSRGTINSDIKKVKKMLKSNNISIEGAKGKGIKVIGEEKKLRKVVSSLMFNNTKTTNLIEDINFKKLFKNMNIEFIKNVIKIAEEQLGSTLSDYSFNSLLIHIAIAIKRIELDKDIVMDENELKNLSKTPEFAVASAMAKMIEERYHIIIPKSEIGYITIHLLGSNLMLKEEKNDDLIYIQLIATTLIGEVEKRTNYDFSIDKQLLDGLIQHIRPMIYRLKHAININNPLLDDIIYEYNEIFIYVEESLMFLKKDLNSKISKEEVGYITLHFMAAVERIKNYNKLKPRVLVVCATGAGTSKFVFIKLKSIFDINIVDTVSSHEAKKIIQKENIDLIISTIPIKVEGIRCILVSPFLTEKNISELSLFFSEYVKSANDGEYKKDIALDCNETHKFCNTNIEINKNVIKNILSIVDKNCTINNYYKLEKEISSYLTKCNKLVRPTLKQLMNCNFIKLNEDVEDWKEAITKGGQILKENGCVNDLYIDAMINNVEKLGSYVVVLPGIAMPHAMPEHGSHKIGFSIMSLKNPINFGNIENDPVKLIITMSAIDNRSHMDALKELMKIIEKDDFMNKIRMAKKREDVLKIFSQ